MSSIAHACNTDDIKSIHCGSLFIVHEFRSCIDKKKINILLSATLLPEPEVRGKSRRPSQGYLKIWGNIFRSLVTSDCNDFHQGEAGL